MPANQVLHPTAARATDRESQELSRLRRVSTAVRPFAIITQQKDFSDNRRTILTGQITVAYPITGQEVGGQANPRISRLPDV
jgi:hypothetical protein